MKSIVEILDKKLEEQATEIDTKITEKLAPIKGELISLITQAKAYVTTDHEFEEYESIFVIEWTTSVEPSEVQLYYKNVRLPDPVISGTTGRYRGAFDSGETVLEDITLVVSCGNDAISRVTLSKDNNYTYSAKETVITVDDKLSETSENPVQNKVVSAEINSIKELINGVEEELRMINEGGIE